VQLSVAESLPVHTLPVHTSGKSACVILPNGVRIELGTEQLTVKAIIAQVLDQAITTANERASSC
jgi:hypothetical protein